MGLNETLILTTESTVCIQMCFKKDKSDQSP